MQAFSYAEARENLKAMIDKVVADRAPLAITPERGEGAVLISASEWVSIEETLYLLRFAQNAQRLLKSIAELDAGDGETHDLIHREGPVSHHDQAEYFDLHAHDAKLFAKLNALIEECCRHPSRGPAYPNRWAATCQTGGRA